MKVIYGIWLCGLVCVGNSLQAQTSALDSIVQVTAEAQGLVLLPYENQPLHGTYWEVMSSGFIAPLPSRPVDPSIPVYAITDNAFLVDATGGQVLVNHHKVASQADAIAQMASTVVSLIAQVQTAATTPPLRTMARTSGMMMASSLASTYAYGNPVYLTNMVASVASDGSMTASFGIAGGTNFVPYDILTASDLSIPRPNWNWLGLGYTSNSYTFYGQPTNTGFYLLAKPAKTMTASWGGDIYGQSDVPYGLTNLLMMSAGYGYNLGVLNNGTVVGWGTSSAAGWVPTNLVGNTVMVAAAWDHNVALLTNGTVQAWGVDYPSIGWPLTEVPANLTNAVVISAQGLHTLALRGDGTVTAWGYNYYGQTNVPAGLTNVTAIAAGGNHSLAVSNGFVIAWGDNNNGQCNVPAGLSNVWDVAASDYHSLALKADGTVVCWGDNAYGESSVPAGLTNVVAIAAGGSPNVDDPYMGSPHPYSLALKKDGILVVWGAGMPAQPIQGFSNVIGISAGLFHAAAIRTGPPTPVVTLEPVSQYVLGGSTVNFTVKGQGLYGVTYQWQTNSVNLPGITNTTLTLTNVQMSQQANYRAVITDNAGNGSLASSNASLTLVTSPVILSQSPMPTNQVFGTLYQTNLNLSVVATAPGMNNGFPLHYQWLQNGINIPSANGTNYSFTASAGTTNNYSVILTNAAGIASAGWQVAVTNSTINVTNDLLLVYNANSQDSSNLCAYYQANRPMVGGANVLSVSCSVGEYTSSNNCDAQIMFPILNWLTNNPTKKPQYVVLFYDMPTRLTNISGAAYNSYGSVSYHLHYLRSDWQPFVTYINGGTLADCEAYVDKVAYFGNTNSPGKLLISAQAGGYGNTNYYFEDARAGTVQSAYLSYPFGLQALQGVTNAGVPVANVMYLPFTNATFITLATNVAGFLTWGANGYGAVDTNANYAINGTIVFTGNSSWYPIETIESFNGQRDHGDGQGNYMQWFSANAFGGTNYSNTPVGAVSNVQEPGAGGNEISQIYFGLWAAGKNFAICAWSGRNTQFYQAIGDPFITK